MDPDALKRMAAVFRSADEAEAIRMQALGQLITAWNPASQLPPAVRRCVGNLLADVLAPFAQRAARQALRSGSRSQRDELAAEALSLLFDASRTGRPRICCFIASGRSLAGLLSWLRQTLFHCWVSQQRRLAARPLGPLGGLEPEYNGDELEALRERALDPCVPFCSRDLALLEEMPIAHRVETLAVAAIWTKVPAQRWEVWLSAYERERNRTLVRPFPPAELLWQDELSKRCNALGLLLGCLPSALIQRLYRQVPRWLSRLDCYRELKET